MVTDQALESITSPPVRLAVLQPTSLCNLNCSYCYVPDRRNALLMSEEVVKAAASFVLKAAPRGQTEFRFLWHAGEPLAAGIDFYKRAFAAIDDLLPHGASVRHSIQTNGTLVTVDWCRLLQAYNVSVGISIDGPRRLHDANRVAWSGRGSHERTMRGLELLRAHGFNPAAICVLTPIALECPDEIYDFFRQQNFPSVGFNVEESEGTHPRSRHLDSTDSELRGKYVRFMRRLWERWSADRGALRVREFERELAMICDLQESADFVATPDEVIPFANITIRRDGAISTFAPELASTRSRKYDDFVVGNVLFDEPADVLQGDALRKLQRDVERGRKACKLTCAYFALCGGGFQSNRIAEHGTLEATATSTCRVHRMALTDVVLSKLGDLSRVRPS